MIPEFGQFALALALALALMQAVVPLAGAARGRVAWMAASRSIAAGQFVFLLAAFAALAWSFYVNDFSVLNVAENSNTALPWYYRLAAVWGSHEGSLLLWALIQAAWTLAVAVFSRELPLAFTARVIGVLGSVSFGFLLYTILTSNPFTRVIPAAAEGRDLNPLLQDPGLVFHPPVLYMGYVGFSVAFAFAIAALIGGRMDAAWARWARPWTTTAWIFLTLGITIGSWWAYYELGWGGWWFWDPVENASFMPWLVGTALIHSLAVTEKRGAFRSWTVLLAIFAFSLSLLGTFLVRSGVLNSVHAFATDPMRGLFILVLLAVVVGTSLTIYAWRAPRLGGGGRFELLSRETLLLLNNAVLTVAAATVFAGTLYPIATDALGLGKISVGPPYYNAVFIPLILPLLALLGVGITVRWKRDDARGLLHTLRWAALAAVIAAVVTTWWVTGMNPMGVLGVALAIWMLWTSVQVVVERVRGRRDRVRALRGIPRGFWGMTLAHIGLATFVLGVSVVGNFDQRVSLLLAPGESYQAAGYTWRLKDVSTVEGPNYTAKQGTVVISRDGETVATLYPQKRRYTASSGMNVMTEAGIDGGLTRDLFVALGKPRDDGSWTLRVQYKPMLRWVWSGALIMAVGGVLGATDPRYRRLLDHERRAAMARGEVAA